MSQWIITPDKYLNCEEEKAIRKTALDLAIIARSRGNQIDVRNHLIIEVALGTGLRVSELSNLKIEDLHLGKGQNTLIVRNGKGGKDRVIGFNSKLKSLILDYLDYRVSCSQYLFHSERGEKMTRFGIGRVFKTIAEKTDVVAPHHSIHSLRHTYATNLYKASGYNLRLVQKQLGHSSIMTTSVYSDVINKDLDEALENMD
ncbi:MAG: phage integrase family protein [Candidatus Marinimicrobia bacterium]|jgi:integrase/recombinase XerD|nr:phage integrase family protein [Candidatus Neomarinimicrobiota bacterium]MBT3683865.1 phage integrase family protein [Candidatus Neomarinimicrobiota bacterium]MBT3760868.1 phage integrase family protein [Candidatus Neomarinimicrobiota bacterium]MBT3896859.1 phage integrase family protein [Candidatus Neomarinimicrobiota bacterium]MBT4538582.1 phage integrase family protein [Candidatus Neomarinimicrobiota bacterium]